MPIWLNIIAIFVVLVVADGLREYSYTWSHTLFSLLLMLLVLLIVSLCEVAPSWPSWVWQAGVGYCVLLVMAAGAGLLSRYWMKRRDGS